VISSLVVIYIGGLVVFGLMSLEIINMLLVMEYLMLVVLIGLFLLVGMENFMVFMIYIVVVVCEACLGLGLLALGVITNSGGYGVLGYLVR